MRTLVFDLPVRGFGIPFEFDRVYRAAQLGLGVHSSIKLLPQLGE
jgi:hypothetical protein